MQIKLTPLLFRADIIELQWEALDEFLSRIS